MLQAVYLALEDLVFDFQLLDGCVDDIDLLSQLDVLEHPVLGENDDKAKCKKEGHQPIPSRHILQHAVILASRKTNVNKREPRNPAYLMGLSVNGRGDWI